MTDLKSLAHPDWPYTGTPWEWRGFGKNAGQPGGKPSAVEPSACGVKFFLPGIYQKQNFGPELK
jgi:hypothetical protein